MNRFDLDQIGTESRQNRCPARTCPKACQGDDAEAGKGNIRTAGAVGLGLCRGIEQIKNGVAVFIETRSGADWSGAGRFESPWCPELDESAGGADESAAFDKVVEGPEVSSVADWGDRHSEEPAKLNDLVGVSLTDPGMDHVLNEIDFVHTCATVEKPRVLVCALPT